MRVVLLGIDAPWWTVIALGALGLLLIGLLLWRRPERRVWRRLAAVLLVVGIALPAIAGWLNRWYDVILVGVLVGLIAAMLVIATRFVGTRHGYRREGSHAAARS